MWKDVAGPLRSLNHPIIIPDMLGYDGTDKPTDPAEYRWDLMTKDLIEIIDTEKVDKFISIGHDWGSACASRMYNYYPNRVAGLVNLHVSYSPPGRTPFDLDALNAMTEAAFGYPFFAYWYLFTADDGAAVLKHDLDRLWNVLHGTNETMKKLFCNRGVMRSYLLNGDLDIELRPYAQDPKMKQAFIDRFTRDGFEAPQCWYNATVLQHHTASDKNLPEGVDKVNVPALYIGGKDDAVCRPEAMIPAIQAGLLPHLEQAEMIDAAHWSTMEKPQEVVSRMESWLKKHFAK